MESIFDEIEKDEIVKSKKKDTHVDKVLIPLPLYHWYLQQNLDLTHRLQNRSHFCLLYLVQLYITNELTEHSRDTASVVIGDKFKDLIKCNSASFNELLNKYFELTIAGNRTGKKVYATGYRLKDEHLNEIHRLMFDVFEKNNSISYVEIDCNNYEEKTLYKTKQGIVDTKNVALKIQGISRKLEANLDTVKCTILKKKSISDAKIYIVNFHIPKGYYQFPISINEKNLLGLLKSGKLDKKISLEYMHILNINKNFPYAVYKKLSTGRLFGTKKINEKKYFVLINYQGKKKAERGEIFKGMYEYDISVSAPTILLQLYYKDFKEKKTAIEIYRDNKKDKRIQFAKLLHGDLDGTIKVVKGVLTALFFGANLLRKYEKFSEEMKKTVNEAQLKKLLSDKEFKTLVKEVRSVYSDLSRRHFKLRKGAKEKVVTNELGLKRKFKEVDRNKAIAFLYQGIEVKILLALYERYHSEVSLLIHDAIISKSRLDTNELAKLAFQASGYNVTFEEKIVR